MFRTFRCNDHIGRAGCKGSQRDLGDDGNDLYRGWNGGYMDYTFVSSSNSSQKGVYLVVCELFLNKIGLKSKNKTQVKTWHL